MLDPTLEDVHKGVIEKQKMIPQLQL